MSVKNFATPVATPVVFVGRIIETGGNVRFRNTVGSGIIRLVLKSSPPKGGELRSGNTKPFVGSVKAGAFPALSCQVWKWAISDGPMLSKTLNTSTLDTLCAKAG